MAQFEGTAHRGGEFMAAGERQLSDNTHGQAANLLNAGTQSTLSFLFKLGPHPGNAATHV